MIDRSKSLSSQRHGVLTGVPPAPLNHSARRAATPLWVRNPGGLEQLGSSSCQTLQLGSGVQSELGLPPSHGAGPAYGVCS
jgi:hypothetical protein